MSAARTDNVSSQQRKSSKTATGVKLMSSGKVISNTAKEAATGLYSNSTHIRKRGNSAGVNLSARVLAISGLDIDSAVSVEAVAGEIIIKAAKPKITLENLLANSPEAKIKQNNKDVAWLDDDAQGLELI